MQIGDRIIMAIFIIYRFGFLWLCAIINQRGGGCVRPVPSSLIVCTENDVSYSIHRRGDAGFIATNGW